MASQRRCASKKLIAWLCWINGDEGKQQDEYCKLCPQKENATTPCTECKRPKILPENIEAINWYSQLSTQWNYSVSGHAIGFRYEGIVALFEIHDIPNVKRKKLINVLELMEAETLKIINKPEEPGDGKEN